MPRINGEIVINRGIDEVFDFVSDELNEPRYNPQMTSVEQATESPIGPGTRLNAAVVSGGRPVPIVVEFTSFQRPTWLGSHTTMFGMVIDGELTFVPAGEATLMRWRGKHLAVGGASRHVAAVAWMGRRQEQTIWSGLKLPRSPMTDMGCGMVLTCPLIRRPCPMRSGTPAASCDDQAVQTTTGR